MLFSDLNKIFVKSNIIGKLPKKKIKFISDHSNNITANTLFVINQKRNFKLSYLHEAISKNLNTIKKKINNFKNSEEILKVSNLNFKSDDPYETNLNDLNLFS